MALLGTRTLGRSRRRHLTASIAMLALLAAGCGAQPAEPTRPLIAESLTFKAILQLRNAPDPARAPALGRVLEKYGGQDHILRYAASQALYAVGSQDAMQALHADAGLADFNGRLAFDCAFRWEMPSDVRDGYLRAVVLRDAGDAPTLELRHKETPTPGHLVFELTVRNASSKSMTIIDPERRRGEVLVFRKVTGHVGMTIWPATCEFMGSPQVTLEPGAARTATIRVEIVSHSALSPMTRHIAQDSGPMGARAGGYEYTLGAAGAYDVVARWNVRSARSGRSVSQPIRVELALP